MPPKLNLLTEAVSSAILGTMLVETSSDVEEILNLIFLKVLKSKYHVRRLLTNKEKRGKLFYETVKTWEI